jgi:cobyrinic acid a,c-diamide synthase
MRLISPRLVVAGLAGDSGKTLLTLGLARSLRERGLAVRTAKKGPDYIDAAWPAGGGAAACVHRVPSTRPREGIGSGASSLAGADVVLVEGNRGLFDGVDAEGTHSTAELAKLLGSPVLLVVDVTKATRTVAAQVLGCQKLDPALRLGGVVLNRVGTARQEALVRSAVEDITGLPVVGALPRLAGDDPLPGRHLGLVTVAEHPDGEGAIARAAEVVARHVDIDRVLDLARGAIDVELPLLRIEAEPRSCCVGYLADPAFSFYYPENLESLRRRGAELVAMAPAASAALPRLDALYIGGGFPEVHAERLAGSGALLATLREHAAAGLPIYAECGGLMLLARALVVDGSSHPMAGVLDIVVEQTRRPQGHGYEVATVDRSNPFFPAGTRLAGHEFHYSRVVAGADASSTVLAVERGCGLGAGRDGIVKGTVWASYLHLHALGAPRWADGFLGMAARFAAERAATAEAGV